MQLFWFVFNIVHFVWLFVSCLIFYSVVQEKAYQNEVEKNGKWSSSIRLFIISCMWPVFLFTRYYNRAKKTEQEN